MTEILVRHFPPPKHDVDLDLETFGQELFSLIDPDLKIMLGDLLRELDLFGDPAFRRIAAFLFLLLQLVFQLAIIGNACYRRFGGWRDQDEIKSALSGES